MMTSILLWFDVEIRYDTTRTQLLPTIDLLWFDVEIRYDTTSVITYRI